MAENAPDNPENRPGLLENSGIYAPKSGCYYCIFMQKRRSFCINIQ